MLETIADIQCIHEEYEDSFFLMLHHMYTHIHTLNPFPHASSYIIRSNHYHHSVLNSNNSKTLRYLIMPQPN
jgi:hypothetical protein